MKKKIKEKSGFGDNFGGRLRKSRKERGLSQTALATILGYNHNGPVSTMENNKTNPDLHTLQRLAECLNVDLHWLITGEASRPDRKLEEDYSKLLTAFAKHISKTVASLLDTRDYWMFRLGDIEKAKASGQQIDDSQIEECNAEYDTAHKHLMDALAVQPYVQKAVERLAAKRKADFERTLDLLKKTAGP